MRLNPIFAGQPTTIFEEMSGLARLHNALNLGQGFPDGEGPEDLRRAAARAVIDGPNQYPQCAAFPRFGRPWRVTMRAIKVLAWAPIASL
jgi:N-succinyldiaminopimelate aminotransferase